MRIETLWFTRCPAPTPASIAIRNGWLVAEFAPDGIEVLSLAASKDRSVHLSHYRHTQPNSFRFGGYVPPLISLSRGADIRIIGIGWPDRTAEIVVPENSAIRDSADLRGKRLGVPVRRNDSVDWWQATVRAGYEDALKKAGLSPEEVAFVEIGIEREYVADVAQGSARDLSLWGARSQFAVQREEAAALVRGEVDALYTDAAMGAILKAAYGLRPVLDLSRAEDDPDGVSGHPTLLTVSGALLDERPDLVARWVAQLLDVEAWCRDNEDEAVRILARDTGVPEDFFAPAYSPRAHLQMDVSLSPRRMALVNMKYDQLMRHGFLDGPFDLEKVVNAGPLKTALAARGTERRSPIAAVSR